VVVYGSFSADKPKAGLAAPTPRKIASDFAAARTAGTPGVYLKTAPGDPDGPHVAALQIAKKVDSVLGVFP
jgi:hypothetical protein